VNLKESLNELSKNIRLAEANLLKTYPIPFRFEEFEWKRVSGAHWRIFYKGDILIGLKIADRIEALDKIEGLLLHARNLQSEMETKLKHAFESNDFIEFLGNKK